MKLKFAPFCSAEIHVTIYRHTRRYCNSMLTVYTGIYVIMSHLIGNA